MAYAPRRRARARWAVVAGSGVALAGFWMAIARGPQPAAAIPAPPATPTPAQARAVAPSSPSRRGALPAAPTAVPAPSTGSSRTAPAAPPRLRTRGS
jgi:hypothetical protein